MLMPKRTKYRRVQRGRLKCKAMRGNRVTNGEFGLVALEPAWITSNQIEAARIAMTRYIRRGGQGWIKPGRVLFEMDGVSEEIAKEAMRLASHKLPIKCRFVTREQLDNEVEG